MPERTVQFRAMEDKDLVVAFKAGDPDAYDEMYRRYSGRIGNVCRRMLSNREDAQEAVQETFLKAYLALPQFNGNYRLGAWLSRIASNVCVDQLRARARTANVVPLYPEAGALAVEEGPEDLVVGDGPEVAEQIGELQPLHARALVLRGVDGLSHREIAGRLSMTPAQVKALLHRARRSFKRGWEGAKGWVAAPALLFRSSTRQLRNASQTGSQLAGATASFSPLLAERVAASAVMVAVALSSLPSTTVTAPVDERRKMTRPSTSQWEMAPPHVSIRERSKDAVARRAGEQRAAVAGDSIRRKRLLPTLEKVLTRAQGSIHSQPEEPPDDGGESLVPLGPKGAQKTAEDVVRQAQELLPDL